MAKDWSFRKPVEAWNLYAQIDDFLSCAPANWLDSLAKCGGQAVCCRNATVSFLAYAAFSITIAA